METLHISQIIEIKGLKEFYTINKMDDNALMSSIETHGQLAPVTINKERELLDGYRRFNILKSIGTDVILVNVIDSPPTDESRVTLNQYREKSVSDKVKELKVIFSSFPKKQGSRNNDTSYNRYQSIMNALGKRWNSENTIRKVEYILENGEEVFIAGIISNTNSVELTYEYLTKYRNIDTEKEYGYHEKFLNGSNTLKVSVNLISEMENLEFRKPTFIIPEVSTYHTSDAIELAQMDQYKSSVDLIFTSIPYYDVRFYDNGAGENQKGHENTVDEYCAGIAETLEKLTVTLKETSNVIINIGETYRDGCGLAVPDKLVHHICSKTKLIYKDRIIWSKSNEKPQGEKVKRLSNNIEYLLWFVVDPKKSKFKVVTFGEKRDIKITHGAKDVSNKGQIMRKKESVSKPYQKIKNHIEQQKIMNLIESAAGKNQIVRKIFSDGGPAVMSECIPVIPILMTTDENDLVFDPFAGTNVTGYYATLLNRKSVATELSLSYHKIGCGVLELAHELYNQEEFEEINVMVNDYEEEYELLNVA
jgi:DNA modification methylase